jgi:hypothetical protein
MFDHSAQLDGVDLIEDEECQNRDKESTEVSLGA